MRCTSRPMSSTQSQPQSAISLKACCAANGRIFFKFCRGRKGIWGGGKGDEEIPLKPILLRACCTANSRIFSKFSVGIEVKYQNVELSLQLKTKSREGELEGSWCAANGRIFFKFCTGRKGQGVGKGSGINEIISVVPMTPYLSSTYDTVPAVVPMIPYMQTQGPERRQVFDVW